VVADGKNLSLQDIRFARTINRIQKAMIQELNKIAVIHLYMLGMEDELNNFTLGLTNPSTQSDLLKVEAWKEKILLYKDAVSDPGNGISAVSHTWAKKTILGMSDEEVKLDLQQQRFEKAIANELETTSEVIKKTGVFTNIDELYGDPDAPEPTGDVNDGSDMGGMGDTGMDSPATEEPVDDIPMDTDGGELGESNTEEDLSIILETKDFGVPKKLNLMKGQEVTTELEKKLKNILGE